VRVHQPRGRRAARRQGVVQQEDRREDTVGCRPRKDDAREDSARGLCSQVIDLISSPQIHYSYLQKL